MTRYLLVLIASLFYLASFAQKREEFFDYSFQPSPRSPYYYVITEKKDSGWYREAYYLSQKTMAMKGWYKDEACKIAHGPMTWYHPTKFLRTKGLYLNGQQEGLWESYNEQGHQTDSSYYSGGHRTGISLHWHDNGFQRDSLNFDGQGNGVQVSWYDDGSFASAGRWTADTVKTGRWKYYHKNGNLLATEDYAAGKLQLCQCYDEAGKALDTADCREREAEPSGGLRGWQAFLQRSLQNMLERKANSREWGTGQLSVVVRFVVEKDGSLSEFTPLTQYGKGVEEEIISLLKRAPRWTPGRQWGRPVRSYHTQPITFEVLQSN